MDTQPGTIWGREPAMVLALVQAVIALVVAFGLSLAPDQIGVALALPEAVLARPTGFGRARTHSDFRRIPIEGADGWLKMSTESA